jgi:hypothetical protein
LAEDLDLAVVPALEFPDESRHGHRIAQLADNGGKLLADGATSDDRRLTPADRLEASRDNWRLRQSFRGEGEPHTSQVARGRS